MGAAPAEGEPALQAALRWGGAGPAGRREGGTARSSPAERRKETGTAGPIFFQFTETGGREEQSLLRRRQQQDGGAGLPGNCPVSVLRQDTGAEGGGAVCWHQSSRCASHSAEEK